MKTFRARFFFTTHEDVIVEANNKNEVRDKLKDFQINATGKAKYTFDFMEVSEVTL